MKTLSTTLPLLLFLLLSQNLELRANAQPIESKIETVTVFIAGAQVGRTASASLPAGHTELIFKGISPEIDPQSIQVNGDGAFTILSVIHQMNYREEQAKRQEIADLEVEKNRILRQQKEKQAMLAVFGEEQKMLEKNQAIGGANTGVSSAELRLALDLHRQRFTEVKLQQLDLQYALATMDSTLKKIGAQLIALNQEKETATSEILVSVTAKTPVNAKFEITYYVRDAGWFATYDFRVQDVSSPIDIAFKANVFHHSGEDWKEVKLKLSNGNPTLSGVAAELQPWYLRFGHGQQAYLPGQRGSGGISTVSGKVLDAQTGEPLIGANILVKGTTIGTVTDIDGTYALNVPTSPTTLVVSYTGYGVFEMPVTSQVHNAKLNAGAVLEEVAVTARNLAGINIRGSRHDATNYYLGGVRVSGEMLKKQTIEQVITTTYQPTSFTFKIELPYTIPSDGKTRMVDIKSESALADYHYFATPKLDETAYLTASITDWQTLNLLDGEVNLFFEGAYLGRSLVDTRSVGDTLEVSLGQDKGIVVKRKKLSEFSKRQFIGGDKTDSRAFEIFVKNNKQQPINITIQDQCPISTDKEISVGDLKHDGATLDEKTKILTWDLALQPREERKLEMRYSVKYPKRKVLTLE